MVKNLYSPAMATKRKNIHVSMNLPAARRSWKLLARKASMSITLHDASLSVVPQDTYERSWCIRRTPATRYTVGTVIQPSTGGLPCETKESPELPLPSDGVSTADRRALTAALPGVLTDSAQLGSPHGAPWCRRDG
ncbi:hypothetical protein KM043_008091 [Ampulex compressa]|nr:hypothetical protein KM043_008091 [Ampulex compressa]